MLVALMPHAQSPTKMNSPTRSIPLLAAMLLGANSAHAAPALDRNMPHAHNHEVVELFQEQARLMEAHLGGQMRVVLLHTDDPLVRQFVAQGITKKTPDEFARVENGLAAVMVDGGQINGVKTRACYIVYNKQRAGHVWRNFLEPMGKGEDMSVGAAFLVGHEVAHCLDHSERTAMLGQKSSWPTEKAAAFGVLPDAWREVGGGDTISLKGYNERATQMYVQRGQMQYTERVADIFGTLWAFSRGAGPEIADVLRASRRHEDWGTHATVPALDGIEDHAAGAKAMAAGEMWSLARGLQVQAGVHESVAMGGEKAGAVIMTPKPKVEPELVATAQQARDPGTPAPATQAHKTPAPAKSQVVNFNNLPKFGQRGFSGN